MAIRYIHQYFAPLTVIIKFVPPVNMDIELADPSGKESVTLIAIPCRNTVSTVELYQLINLIESQAKARCPQMFLAHVMNQLQLGQPAKHPEVVAGSNVSLASSDDGLQLFSAVPKGD